MSDRSDSVKKQEPSNSAQQQVSDNDVDSESEKHSFLDEPPARPPAAPQPRVFEPLFSSESDQTSRPDAPQARVFSDLFSSESDRNSSTIASQVDDDLTDSDEEEDSLPSLVIQRPQIRRLDDYSDTGTEEHSDMDTAGDYDTAHVGGGNEDMVIEEPSELEVEGFGGIEDAGTVDFGANDDAETVDFGGNDDTGIAEASEDMNLIHFSDNNDSAIQEREQEEEEEEEEEEDDDEAEENDTSSQLDYVELNYIERGDTPIEERRIADFELRKKRTIVHTLTVEELDDTIASLFEGFLPGIPTVQLKQILEDIQPYSLNIRKYGLRSDNFQNFFYLLNSRAFFAGTIKKFLAFLLPRDKVSEQCIVKIIGKLSRIGEDIRVVDAFLKWTIVVFDYLDSTETIRKLYPVLFHYLGFKTTRSSICHLLYFITRKEDVTPYRIRKLQSLVEKEKDNRSLIGLLMVYNSFDKSVEVPVNVRLRDMFVFEHPDPAMKAELKQIKDHWGDDRDVLGMTKPRLRLPRKQEDPSSRKKSKHSEENDESAMDDINVMGIYNEIQQLHHSNQLQTILEDRKIQHLLVCNPNDDAIKRLSYFLGHQLLSTVRWNNNKDKFELHDLLKRLLRLAQFSKSQLAIVNLFLREYLRSWNGIEFCDEILGLISFIKPADYEELYQNILLPLYRKYYVLDVTWKAKLINCYTDWLKNWALLDWRGHKEQEETSDTDVDKVTWMFEGLSLRVDYFVTIQKVIEHVDKISIVGLLAENDDPLLQHATLSFFELVASIPLQHDIPEIIVPSIDLVCRCFFSSNAMALSRICGILCQYVIAFSENDQKDDDWLSRHSPDYLNMFNTYVTDVCSALWKNKALTIGGNAMAFTLSEENIENFTDTCNTRGDVLSSFSSLTQSGSLAGFSKSFLTELETREEARIYHKEAVTAESLRQLQEQGGIGIDYFEYRVKFLNYLTSKGLNGIQDLLSSSMRSLIRYQQEHSV